MKVLPDRISSRASRCHPYHGVRPHSNGLAKFRKGFTLAEAAITIAIVGLTITYTLQALTSAMTTAAHTHEMKLAREMAIQTLGEIETGQYQAEMNEVIVGDYPDDVAPYMSYQIAFGDTALPTRGSDRQDDSQQIDNWANRRQWEDDRNSNNSDDDEEPEEEYEKVRIRVIFPKHAEELNDSLEIEAWIPWAQVYGAEEEEAGTGDESDDPNASGDDPGNAPSGDDNEAPK